MKPEITDEIGLIGPGGFEATSGHQEEDHRAMDPVASAHTNSGLATVGMDGAWRIELHVHF